MWCSAIRLVRNPGKPTVWGGRRVTFAWSTLLRRKPTNYSQSAGSYCTWSLHVGYGGEWSCLCAAAIETGSPDSDVS